MILKASWHLAGVQTRIDIGGGRFAGLGLEIGRKQVYQFGPQNRGVSDVAGWRWWRPCGVAAKVASRQSKVMKVVCLSSGPVKTWTVLPLRSIRVACFM